MKKVYTSKMFWVNAVTLSAGILGYVAGSTVIADNASLVAIIVALQGAVNIVLRFLTSKSVEL